MQPGNSVKLRTGFKHKHMVLLIKCYSLQHGEPVILCSWIATSCMHSQRREHVWERALRILTTLCSLPGKSSPFQNAQLLFVASRLPTLILSSKGFFPLPPFFLKASLWLFYFSITQAPAVTALRQYLLCETHLCICEGTSLLDCTYNGC